MLKKAKGKRIVAVLIVAFILVLVFLAIYLPKRAFIQSKVDGWADRNDISINKVSFSKSSLSRIEKIVYDGKYSITVFCDEFDSLTPARMRSIVRDWYEDEWVNDKLVIFNLDYIASNGKKYKVDTDTGAVELNGTTIASGQSSKYNYSNSYNSSSSSSQSKTATCNYCNGTGKVNGEKCPWCNGSGKTYDNYFNDILGD